MNDKIAAYDVIEESVQIRFIEVLRSQSECVLPRSSATANCVCFAQIEKRTIHA